MVTRTVGKGHRIRPHQGLLTEYIQAGPVPTLLARQLRQWLLPPLSSTAIIQLTPVSSSTMSVRSGEALEEEMEVARPLVVRRSISILIIVLVLALFTTGVRSFYVRGVSPQEFSKASSNLFVSTFYHYNGRKWCFTAVTKMVQGAAQSKWGSTCGRSYAKQCICSFVFKILQHDILLCYGLASMM